MTKPEKKKLKQQPDEKIYFLYEDNRALWEGRSKQFANPGEVLYQVYDVEPPETDYDSNMFELVMPGLIVVLSSGALWWLVSNIISGTQAFDPETGSLIFAACWFIFMGAGAFSYAFANRQQLNKYNQYSENSARLLSDVIRHGTYITGYVDRVRNHFTIYFYYYDDEGNYQTESYTTIGLDDDKSLIFDIEFGSRLAIIRYKDRFVIL